MERGGGGSKISAPSTSGLSVELLLGVIDIKYGCCMYFTFTLLPLQDTDKQSWEELFDNPPDLLTEVCQKGFFPFVCHCSATKEEFCTTHGTWH